MEKSIQHPTLLSLLWAMLITKYSVDSIEISCRARPLVLLVPFQIRHDQLNAYRYYQMQDLLSKLEQFGACQARYLSGCEYAMFLGRQHVYIRDRLGLRVLR